MSCACMTSFLVQSDPSKLGVLCNAAAGAVFRIARVVWSFNCGVASCASWGFATVDDWLAKRAGVLAYLCQEWFRMTRGIPDRENRNTARCATAKIWRTAIEAFQGWAGATEPVQRCELRPQPVGDTMISQAVGCFVRHLLECGVLIEHNDEFMTHVLDAIYASLAAGKSMPEIMREKQLELQSRGLILPYPLPKPPASKDPELPE